mmetsp:Transcript_11628/g.32787  ORF Transcript_11628/g.32787 Transcript_11628/m.32787 type:complete len:206 (-) Transcript_11628:67-684(-)
MQYVRVDGWQAHREHRHCEQRGLHRSAGLVVLLHGVEEPARKEGAAHDEEQIAEDGPQERALNDCYLVVPDTSDAEQHFNHVAEGRVEKPPCRLTQLGRNVLCGLPDQPRQGDDRHKVEQEDVLRLHLHEVRRIAHGDCQKQAGQYSVAPNDVGEALEVVLGASLSGLLTLLFRARRRHRCVVPRRDLAQLGICSGHGTDGHRVP